MQPDQFLSDRAGKATKTRTSYWAFVPHPLPPEIHYSVEMIAVLAEAERALGELSGIGRILPNPHMLVAPAVRHEAVLSSRIEGTHAGIEDLFFFEAEPESAADLSDVREVANYVTALEYGLDRLRSLPLSLRLIREIHERLMRGVRGDAARPGEFRTTQNWIGPPGCTLMEATFVPPPPPEMLEALDALEKYLHRENDLTPPLVRLALIHSQFETIHPFADGNGRVGRLLLILLLVHWGLLPLPLLYLSAFFERHREDYYRGLLNVGTRGDWEGWIVFFLRGVRAQALGAAATAHRLLETQARYRVLLTGKRTPKITLPLMESLFTHPVVTAPQVRDRWRVNFRTALAAIEELARVGILLEVTGQRRNRAWVAREILDIVSASSAD